MKVKPRAYECVVCGSDRTLTTNHRDDCYAYCIVCKNDHSVGIGDSIYNDVVLCRRFRCMANKRRFSTLDIDELKIACDYITEKNLDWIDEVTKLAVLPQGSYTHNYQEAVLRQQLQHKTSEVYRFSCERVLFPLLAIRGIFRFFDLHPIRLLLYRNNECFSYLGTTTTSRPGEFL